MADTLDVFGDIQKLNRLEKSLDDNQRECEVLDVGRNNCRHCWVLGDH